MNKRMHELYIEAAEFAYKICKEEERPGGHADLVWSTLFTGKFAELIVHECAYTARQCRTVRGVDAEDVAQHIESTLLKKSD